MSDLADEPIRSDAAADIRIFGCLTFGYQCRSECGRWRVEKVFCGVESSEQCFDFSLQLGVGAAALTEQLRPSRRICLERDVEYFLDLLPAMSVHTQLGLTWIGLELVQEKQPRLHPVALDSSGSDAEELGDFRFREAGEESQLHHLAKSLID